MKAPVVVAVINLKGGVGKTTVVALLARYAARKGLNVLAVDLDPQANLSQALMTEREYMQFMQKGEPSIVELFKRLPAAISRSGCSCAFGSNHKESGGQGKFPPDSVEIRFLGQPDFIHPGR